MLEDVDPNSFRYYRYGGANNKYGADEAHKTEWTTREADGCGAASYNESTGAVEWKMGDTFQLENGVTYVVTFDVWPSQAAYDLVADLNNGVKLYENLSTEEKAQIAVLNTNPVTYALKTNTDNVKATYNKTTKTGDTVTVSDSTDIPAAYNEGTIQNMALSSMKLRIKKVFNDTLTAAEDRETEVTLKLQRRVSGSGADFVDYNVPGTTSPNIVLNAENNWECEFYVAPGLKVDDKVLEHGYDFTITEPDIDYHYELNGEIINPMIVDNEQVFVGDGFIDQNGDGNVDPTVVNRVLDSALTAENAVKGGIDIKKIVVDAAGKEITPASETFTIEGYILGADGQPYTWNEGDDVNATGAYHMYDKDGNRIVYKGHFASTANITLTLKAGEYVRFINVPKGSTFEFHEVTTGMPVNFQFDKIEGKNLTKETNESDFTEYEIQPAVENGKVSGTVYGNVSSQVTVTNKALKGEYFFVYHSSNNTIEKVFADDARVTKGAYDAEKKTYTYTFNIANETLTGNLYGGYFKAYGGQKMTDAEIAAATYTEDAAKQVVTVYDGTHTGGFWATDTGATPYTGSVAAQWKNANVYTVAGTAMHPESGKVYYLKEVPDQYFRPALYYVYDDRAENKDLKKLYLMVPTDDSLYQFVDGEPINIGQSKRLYATFKVTEFNGNTTSITVPSLNERLTRGYLTVWDAQNKIVKNATYDWTPYFVTKDGVKVTSVMQRHLNMGNIGFSETWLSAFSTDTRVPSTCALYQPNQG